KRFLPQKLMDAISVLEEVIVSWKKNKYILISSSNNKIVEKCMGSGLFCQQPGTTRDKDIKI
ncbi:hypothetical protein MUP56_02230, partial [Patescibacteria group bacterium]|nr:hypothetical protein [Patescibacteria group bacterium]